MCHYSRFSIFLDFSLLRKIYFSIISRMYEWPTVNKPVKYHRTLCLKTVELLLFFAENRKCKYHQRIVLPHIEIPVVILCNVNQKQIWSESRSLRNTTIYFISFRVFVFMTNMLSPAGFWFMFGHKSSWRWQLSYALSCQIPLLFRCLVIVQRLPFSP